MLTFCLARLPVKSVGQRRLIFSSTSVCCRPCAISPYQRSAAGAAVLRLLNAGFSFSCHQSPNNAVNATLVTQAEALRLAKLPLPIILVCAPATPFGMSCAVFPSIRSPAPNVVNEPVGPPRNSRTACHHAAPYVTLLKNAAQQSWLYRGAGRIASTRRFCRRQRSGWINGEW